MCNSVIIADKMLYVALRRGYCDLWRRTFFTYYVEIFVLTLAGVTITRFFFVPVFFFFCGLRSIGSSLTRNHKDAT